MPMWRHCLEKHSTLGKKGIETEFFLYISNVIAGDFALELEGETEKQWLLWDLCLLYIP
jgi:hypothetical protein